jgi:hypothetical protein
MIEDPVMHGLTSNEARQVVGDGVPRLRVEAEPYRWRTFSMD